MSDQNKNEPNGTTSNSEPPIKNVSHEAIPEPKGTLADTNVSLCAKKKVVVVASIEDLQALLSGEALDVEALYEVTIGGATVRYNGHDADFACLLLPSCPVAGTEKSATFTQLIELFDRKDLATVLPEESEAWLPLNSSSNIKIGEGQMTLPYGTFSFVNLSAPAETQTNPLVRQQIQKAYQPLVDHGPAGIQRHLDNSLSVISKLTTKDFTERVKKLQADYPELDVIPAFKALEHHIDLLGRLFTGAVLPELLLNQSLKKLLSCSLITPDLEFNTDQGLIISSLFYRYVSQLPLIQEVCACIEGLKLRSLEKSNWMAVFDISGGLESALGVAKEPTVSDKPREKPPVEYTTMAPETVKEHFWLDLTGLGVERELITLTGRCFSSTAMKKLQALTTKHPHFTQVIDYLLPFAKASFMQAKPFRIPPLLVAGPPGIGKSKFLNDLSEVVDMGRNFFQASQFTCGSQLVGLTHAWRSSHQGDVAEAMSKDQTTNPLIIFDELDRMPSKIYSNGVPTLTALMRLLEPVEAKNFVDAFHNEPHDVSQVNWIFTCNQPRTLPYALLTRLHVIYVYPPREQDQIDNIHTSIWKGLIDTYQMDGLVYEQLDAEIVSELRERYYDDLEFRKTYKLLERAMNNLVSTLMPGHKSYLTLKTLLSRVSINEKPVTYLLN